MKRKHFFIMVAFAVAMLFSACSENYSNGERIGLITQFSNSGLVFKSWEGHLNLTQTGMNSSSMTPFDFSVDNDHEPSGLVAKIDSAARFGWKVKLVYHETFGLNWFSNRGDTNHFITECQIIDKTPMKNIFGNGNGNGNANTSGHVIDTIYVVIDKTQLKK